MNCKELRKVLKDFYNIKGTGNMKKKELEQLYRDNYIVRPTVKGAYNVTYAVETLKLLTRGMEFEDGKKISFYSIKKLLERNSAPYLMFDVRDNGDILTIGFGSYKDLRG